jgi:3-oxoacyl-[acyl-carrier-protein] synthase-3
MIGLLDIASYVPAGFESNLDKQARFGIDSAFLREKIGVERVARKAGDEDTSDLCARAFRTLQQKCGLDAGDIEAIIVCTQNPDGGGIPHTSAIVHAKIGAPEACAAFDIGLGCSGYVYSLSVACAFMQANGLRRGLLFTADPYSKIVDPEDKNTVLLFGDAATVTLLGPAPEARWIPRAFRFATRGSDGGALTNRSGKLQMNGRAVFTFSATAVPAQIRQLLASEQLSAEDVDLFVLHQGSKYIVDTLRERLDLPLAKVPVELALHGNSVSSTIPLVLESRLGIPGLKRLLLAGFGVGLSWASCLLERRPEQSPP